MKKFVKCKVKEICFPSFEYIHLKLQISLKNFNPSPGQFVMLSKDEFNQTFPRPFSIFNFEKNEIELLIKKVGKITKKISELKRGDTLNVLGPLGNFFQKKENVLLIAGGYGIAPIYFYLKKYKNLKNLKLFYGGKGKKDILFLKEFEKLLEKDSIFITTEDGSFGEKGLVIKPLINFLKSNAKNFTIYSCGPIPLFKSLNKISLKNKLKLYTSMDPLMACGFGICFACAIPTKFGNLCACTEGPVFDSSIIDWEKL